MKNNDSEKLISKHDVILLVVFIIVGIIAWVFFNANAKTGFTVRVSVDGEIVEILSLDSDSEYVVELESGKNIIVVKDGEVSVANADCPDKICVKHNPISKVGETIICLPHKLVVEILE